MNISADEMDAPNQDTIDRQISQHNGLQDMTNQGNETVYADQVSAVEVPQNNGSPPVNRGDIEAFQMNTQSSQPTVEDHNGPDRNQ